VKIEFKMFENLFKMDLKKQKKPLLPFFLTRGPLPSPLSSHRRPIPHPAQLNPPAHLTLSSLSLSHWQAGHNRRSFFNLTLPPFLPLVPAAGLSRRPRPPCAPPPPPLRHEGGAATHSTTSSPLPLPKTNIAPSPWPLMAARHRPHRL
jgi:hypothetical protein